MSDNDIELSRRKILAGLGAVGAAGAGAGLGTSALFSDEESFTGNTIAAGTLDLKVDWEEHYSYPQLFGMPDPTTDLDVTRSEPDDTEGYVALPDPESPAVWVAEDDLGAYMDNTSIEAYPDVDDDGVQDGFNTDQIGPACTDGADTSTDLDPEGGLRTLNADTEGGAPLVNLADVKPGDFGELTLSFHLCNNPGYVWLGGELVEAAEGGHTEPEGASDAESGGPGEQVTDLDQSDGIELLDEIEATVWYDTDCDNVFEPGGEEGDDGEPADVMLVLDRSGSMSGQKITNAKSGASNLVDALGPNDRVGLVSFASSTSEDAALTSDHEAVNTAIGNLSAGGGTTMGPAVDAAQDELQNGANARSGARKIMIVLGDGAASDDPTDEASDARTAGTEIFTIAYGNPGSTAEATLQDMATDPDSDHYFEADVSEIESLLQSLGGTVGSSGESLITRGSLRSVLQELETGIALDAGLDNEGRDCYPALQTNCVGLSWHLPVEAGNEVQSDSVSFDLGFYAEQCRNNDGGQPMA